MKRLLIIFLCTVMVFAAGCGGKQPEPTTAPETSAQPATSEAAETTEPEETPEPIEDYSESWRERPLPSSFDLRSVDTDGDGVGDRCYVTPVRFQNPFGTCWGFAAIAAAEISILGSVYKDEPDAWKTLDLSEKQLAYFTEVALNDPDNPQNGEGVVQDDITNADAVYNNGGTSFLAAATFAQGIGPSYENKEEYEGWFEYHGKAKLADHRYLDGEFRSYCYSEEDDWTIPEELRFKQDFILTESFMLPSPRSNTWNGTYAYYEEATNQIKEQLLDKRGVIIGFTADTSLPSQDSNEAIYLDLDNWAHYTWDEAAAPNHAVTIIGWDDDYPKENFISDHMPPENGAFLVKNSWGSGELDFPYAGSGHWGIPVPKTDENGDPVLDENGDPVMVGSGYFWLSYYDKSLAMPEAFVFAPQTDPAHVDQYDYLSASEIHVEPQAELTRMANVFPVDRAMMLDNISCITASSDNTVEYAVYILNDDYAAPDDGFLAVSGTVNYKYPGFHKIPFEAFFLQPGQHYSIVITIKDNTDYDINTPIAVMLKGYVTQRAIINPGESYVFAGGEWFDYKDVTEEFMEDDPYKAFGGQVYYDNFPIKGYAQYVVGDMSLVLFADEPVLSLKDSGNQTDVHLYFRGAAGLPVGNPKIDWTLLPGSEEIIDLEIDEEGVGGTVTAKKLGTAHVAASVEDVGTSILTIHVSRPVPARYFPNSIVMEYTGKPLEPACTILAAGNVRLKENEDYLLRYSDNVKCGIAGIEVLYPDGESFETPVTMHFGIRPGKAELLAAEGTHGSLSVTVQDQWASGISGYTVEYRPEGQDDWTAATFEEGVTFTVDGLSAGDYDVRVSAFVDTSGTEKDAYNADTYFGDYSDVRTVKVN